MDNPALPNYKFGERLGQGAFGTVWKALDWRTGQTVSVKQIGLSNIPKADLPSVMSEIDLLKNLNHPNIVQYKGFVKTSEFLYIILEYCENGSLYNITKKFGRFPESLVALYILQVLQGLLYLHDQGVIHRDIKGSNILATKEGSIKLADFGVATRTGGPADASVVGSPYWMAPEVVECLQPTSASDIWSLGALVIELLTGKPPYHFLDPMPALFRIVNDDCPPIPETASAVARDFLLQCFQKDVNLRISARKLMRHPWMVAAKKQADQTQRDQQLSSNSSAATTRMARPISGYEDTVQRVQEWNEALNAPPTSKPSRTSDERPRTVARRPSTELASRLQAQLPNAAVPNLIRRQPTEIGNNKRGTDLSQTQIPLPISLIRPISTSVVTKEEMENTDNWDNDFEEGISISKIVALEKDAADQSAAEEEDHNSDTIRPPSSANSPIVKPPSMVPIVEDYSDLVGDEDTDPFKGRVASLQLYNSQKKRILHPADISNSFPNSPKSTVTLLPTRNRAPIPSLLSQATPITAKPKPPMSPPPPSMQPGSRPSTPVPSIEKYSEAEEDYSDVFEKPVVDEPDTRSLQLNTRLSSKSWLGDDDSDEDDPFAEVDVNLEDGDVETRLARESLLRACARVSELIEIVSSNEDEYALREASVELIAVLEDDQEVTVHFVRGHGVIAVIELLQVTRSREMLAILLRLINLIVGSDAESLEKICLVGSCPVILSFANNKYSREIRLEAALFCGAMCRTSLLTLQMFVSCRGLKTLVEMLDENYNDGKDLVWMAVDGVSRVFELQGPTPRNDFCRIFAQEGLLEPLSAALLHLSRDNDALAQSAKVKVVHIFVIFAQGDRKVKEAMANRAIVLRLVKAIGVVGSELLPPVLKTIKNLTMLPSSLEVLQHANAIEALVQVLADYQVDGKLAAEIQNHTVNALFNLCRLSKNRQEEAAIAGVIPLLQSIVQGPSSSPLKQFALPILCDFAHASKTCRKLLWRHDGLNFYLGLLKDSFFAIPALEAILAWLQDETARVEDCLLAPAALELLLRVFCKTKTTSFENLLEPFQKILRTSNAVASRLALNASFFKRVIEMLTRGGKAIVRLNLLRVTKTVFESVPDRKDKLIRVPLLVSTITTLSKDDPAVLVKELAKELVVAFEKAREASNLSTAKRTSLVPRMPRRTTSETSIPSPSSIRSSTGTTKTATPNRGTFFGRA